MPLLSGIKLYLVAQNILLLFVGNKIYCWSRADDNELWSKIRDSQFGEPLEGPGNWLDLSASEQLAKRSQLAYMISPISKQLIELPLDLQPDTTSGQQTNTSLEAPSDLGDCVTSKSSIKLEREQLDPATGRLVRICRGFVEANRCQGYCSSSTRPSVLSSSGVKRVS